MGDIKLFRLEAGKAHEIPGAALDLEKQLQTQIEHNLEPLLGVRFLASEYSTGKTHAGRIDTLGLDENNCPVILEYKRSSSENVINQGLFYLDWLMDHQAEFKLMVLERFDKPTADLIDWNAPRLICIAADFTKYDEHAVQQINRNIELIRYRIFGPDLLLLELANAVSVKTTISSKPESKPKQTSTGRDKTIAEWLSEPPGIPQMLLESLDAFVFSLGDDVQRKDLRLYVAYKRIKNFVTVAFKKNGLYVYANIDPQEIELKPGFTRDVTNIGHWGTGDLEITLTSEADLVLAKSLIMQAYEGRFRNE